MKITNPQVKSSLRRSLAVIAAAALVSVTQNTANATQTVRELFDGLNAGHDYTTIDGLAKTDATTLGLQGAWVTSPAGSTSIVYKDTWTLNWPLQEMVFTGGGLVLPDSGTGANGMLNYNAGGNVSTNIDPNTQSPYGNLSSQSYATRPLTPNASINFQASGTYYFNVRIVSSYPWAIGNSSAGVGFSTGNGTNDHFVGAGLTMPSPFLAADGVTDIGDSSYITVGTLGQPGVTNSFGSPANVDPTYGVDISGGPYFPSAYGTIGLWTNIVAGADPGSYPNNVVAGLLLAQLTTTPSGASTLKVKTYLPWQPIYTNVVNGVTNITLDPDINNIAWEATYNFQETNVMNHLLVWMHGSTLEYDAIRVGTTYADVMGLEMIGQPSASPSNSVYGGTTVTLSQNTGLNTGAIPMSFQWLSNSIALPNQTNATLVLASPDTNSTADYSVIVNNYYGSLTSAVTHVTINPPLPPIIVQQPVPITRYIGSPSAAFNITVDGSPQFTYQWFHGATAFPPTTTAVVTNQLLLPPIASTDAGGYYVVITNQFGSATSIVASLTELVPATNSYAGAVTALPNLFGYWRLDDSSNAVNPSVVDFWGNENGKVIDAGNVTFDVPGAPFFGFPNPHPAMLVGTVSYAAPYRVNLSRLVYSNAMTFTMWVNGGVQFVNHNGYNAGWGLENASGSLQFDWNGYDGVGKNSVTWNSGMTVPANTWTFVALVVEPTQATVYVGADRFSLNSVSSGPLSTSNGAFTNSDSTTIGDTAGLYPFGLGRNQLPWAEDGAGSQWASTSGTWSDVAIYYSSLSANQITNLYESAVGLAIDGTADGSGNLNLNWFPAYTLQEATSVTGPWTDVSGSPTPPYSVTIDTAHAQHYYRVRK